MKLIIASHNEGKVKEFRDLLADLPFEVVSLADLEDKNDVKETGKTFIENARLKAEFYSNYYGHLTLADDSGLVVPALGDKPGVHSARYSGKDHDDQANNKKLLRELNKTVSRDRSAYFISSIVVASPQREIDNLEVEGRVYGLILQEPQGENGFGYDPLFYLPSEDATFAQLPQSRKNKLSHRGRAIEALLKQLPAWLEGATDEISSNE